MTDDKVKQSWVQLGKLLIALTLMVAVGSASAWYFWPERRALELCDRAIQKKLIAPVTYHRVRGEKVMDIGLGQYQVTFDAENAFGAPVRRNTDCSVHDGYGSVGAFYSGDAM